MKVLKCPCGCHLEEFSKEEVKLKSVCMSCNCGHIPPPTITWLGVTLLAMRGHKEKERAKEREK